MGLFSRLCPKRGVFPMSACLREPSAPLLLQLQADGHGSRLGPSAASVVASHARGSSALCLAMDMVGATVTSAQADTCVSL